MCVVCLFVCLLLREQLCKAEEQIQATGQEMVFLARERNDAVNVGDQTMAELHAAQLESGKVRKSKSR